MLQVIRMYQFLLQDTQNVSTFSRLHIVICIVEKGELIGLS